MRLPILVCVLLGGCNHLQQLEFQSQRGVPVAAEPRAGHFLVRIEDLPNPVQPGFQEVRSEAEVVRASLANARWDAQVADTLHVASSHDGGLTWSTLPEIALGAPSFALVGEPPSARVYFGRYQFEYDRLRGAIDYLEQTPAGFVRHQGEGHPMQLSYENSAWWVTREGADDIVTWREPATPDLGHDELAGEGPCGNAYYHHWRQDRARFGWLALAR